jgi:hypothetical protein
LVWLLAHSGVSLPPPRIDHPIKYPVSDCPSHGYLPGW